MRVLETSTKALSLTTTSKKFHLSRLPERLNRTCLRMALVTISGYPASGKTRRAEQLHALLKLKMEEPSYVGPKFKVVILSDDALHIKRDVYDGTPKVS